ncbi:MAG TPA: lactate racemase domain-containing protein [Desulfomonilaceae bacterium]|nr:lactate racemase domain-containing protein [Desulfomonilaceae bacterium]
MRKDYYLCSSRNQKAYFSVPPQWSISHFIESREDLAIPPVGQMVQEALEAPLGTAPLKDLVPGANKVAILVDDWTRPTPVADILQVLLPYLVRNGIPREKVTVIIALGTHVSLTQDELVARVGSSTASLYRIIQHDAWQHDLVPIPVPEDDRVVKINPEVAQADVKIGMSSILPHPMAGFGGGPKIVVPGVSNFEFVMDHHMRHTIHPRSVAGLTKGNPFHESCLRSAQAVGLDFSINCVYNQHGEVVRIIGGSLEAAFAGAVQAYYKTLGVRFEEKVDITITSTYPHTHGHQFCKGLAAPDSVTKENGAILMLAPLEKPVSSEFVDSFDQLKDMVGANPAEYVKEAMGQGKPFLADKPVEFNMAMSTVILRPKIRTILVSQMISEKEARTMGFDYALSLEEGVRLLGSEYPDARVAIFPSGGLIIPMT